MGTPEPPEPVAGAPAEEGVGLGLELHAATVQQARPSKSVRPKARGVVVIVVI
jgi:hypothetical protein